MIVKSSRIPTRRTKAIQRYLSEEGENETSNWLRGSATDVAFMGLASRVAGRVYSVRHVVVAPEILMDLEELLTILPDLQQEYGLSDLAFSQLCVVEHLKRRAGRGRGVPHFHLALPEFDLETGRVMDSGFTRIRDEKLARLWELKLGHPSTVGRFNREVFERLRASRSELDLKPYQDALTQVALEHGLPAHAWLDVRAKAAFSEETHCRHDRRLLAAAQRTGLDTSIASLPNIRAQFRSWAVAMPVNDLVRQIQHAGYALRRMPNQTWMVWGQGIQIGPLHLLTGLPQNHCDLALRDQFRGSEQSPLVIHRLGNDANSLKEDALDDHEVNFAPDENANLGLGRQFFDW